MDPSEINRGNTINSNGIESSTQTNLFHLQGMINGHPCKILVNCGSSKNYMSLQLAKELKVVVAPVKGSFLMIVDGIKGSAFCTLNPILLRIGKGYVESMKFVVAPLHYDIILGLPWLERHRAQVD